MPVDTCFACPLFVRSVHSIRVPTFPPLLWAAHGSCERYLWPEAVSQGPRVNLGLAQAMCCTPTRNNKRHLPRRATRLSVSLRWPARAKTGKTASALRICDLRSTAAARTQLQPFHSQMPLWSVAWLRHTLWLSANNRSNPLKEVSE